MTQTFFQPHGSLQICLPILASVGISNLADVLSHDITHIVGSTSHVVQLRGGGYLQFAYSAQGMLIELSGHGVNTFITPSGEITVSARTQT